MYIDNILGSIAGCGTKEEEEGELEEDAKIRRKGKSLKPRRINRSRSGRKQNNLKKKSHRSLLKSDEY